MIKENPNSEISVTKLPHYEDYFLSLNEFNYLDEEIEILNTNLSFYKDKFEVIIDIVLDIILNSFAFIFGIPILFSIPLYVLSLYIDLTIYNNIALIFIYLFGLYCILIVLFVFFRIFGLEYFNYKKLSIYKKKKYANYINYKKAYSNYLFSIRLTEKQYWLRLSGRLFEIELGNLFKSKGFKVDISKQGGDGGVDLILSNQFNDYTIGVQCKAHNSKISPHIARDLLGTVHSFKFSKGLLITLVGGTEGTIEFCKRNNLIIWDVNDIVNFKINENVNVESFTEFNK